MYCDFMTDLVLNFDLKIRVLTVEYNLPGEDSFLYPFQEDLYYSICGSLLSRGVPASKLVLGGDSSGGYNALKGFEKMCDEGLCPRGLFLVSPLLDLWIPRTKDEEIERFGGMFFLSSLRQPSPS